MKAATMRRKKARAAVPENHTEVAEYHGGRHSHLSRVKDQYFVGGKPVTLRKAFDWFIRYEYADSGFATCNEVNHLLKLVAKAMK